MAATRYSTNILQAPWGKVTPGEAKRWMKEDRRSWRYAAISCQYSFSTRGIPDLTEALGMASIDTEIIESACLQSIETKKPVRIGFDIGAVVCAA